MSSFIKNIFSLKDENSKKQIKNDSPELLQFNEIKNSRISFLLDENKTHMLQIFQKCSDLIIREFKISNNPELTAMIVYIENMTQSGLIEENIINKLILNYKEDSYHPWNREDLKYLLGISNKDVLTEINTAIDSILDGKIVLFINGVNEAIIINLNNPPNRNVEEPAVETVIRGPREGFIESISTNIVLIRKKIKSTDMKIEALTLGRKSKTNIVITYISNVVNQKIVNELKERLGKIDVDAVLGSNYIKEYIEDEPFWGFPTIFSTERPDVVANKLLQGRIAILVDGTPLVSTIPAIFFEFIESSEDFYINYIAATINRWLRYIAFILSLVLPSAFIAITTFHQEVIPTSLLVSFMNSRVDVPYPALFECFLMLLIYEILREASIRMPRTVGQTIGIIGALALGQSAVEAGLVSTPMIIVVAITAISSFTIPSTEMYEAIIFPRFILLLLGGFSGFLGLTCGLLIIFMKLSSSRTFGVPYVEPMVPVILKELPDLLLRRPLWNKFTRPWFIVGKRSIRRKQESHIKSMKKQQRK